MIVVTYMQADIHTGNINAYGWDTEKDPPRLVRDGQVNGEVAILSSVSLPVWHFQERMIAFKESNGVWWETEPVFSIARPKRAGYELLRILKAAERGVQHLMPA